MGKACLSTLIRLGAYILMVLTDSSPSSHALQLRQAKLFFPSVHLIVGVVSSTNCAKHKNLPVLSSSERYASVRNCRWVDEVVEDAPWVIDQELMDKLNVDYVAHDEAPYGGQGSEDIYRFAKDQGTLCVPLPPSPPL